jgi:hypothetical protein
MPELTITSPYFHSSRLQHIYHGQPYAIVDLNPMPESTLSPPLGTLDLASATLVTTEAINKRVDPGQNLAQETGDFLAP